ENAQDPDDRADAGAGRRDWDRLPEAGRGRGHGHGRDQGHPHPLQHRRPAEAGAPDAPDPAGTVHDHRGSRLRDHRRRALRAGDAGSEAISKWLGCTETRIGSYAYEGMTRVGKREHLQPDRCPLRIVVTVVSTARPGQIIVDGGMKAFTSYPPIPYGYCLEHP